MIAIVLGVVVLAAGVALRLGAPHRAAPPALLMRAADVAGALLVGGGVVMVTEGAWSGLGLAAAVVVVLAVVGQAGTVTRTVDRVGDAGRRAPDSSSGGSPVEFLLGDAIVREIMVPRTDMVTVDVDADIEAIGGLLAAHGFSRFPIVGSGLDDVVGLAIAKDLLMPRPWPPRRVGDIGRPVQFVPETMRLADLLRHIQGSGSHMVIVVDEYGGTAGLVTIEDLLEELVGEIVDEFDGDEDLLVQPLAEGTWRVDGRLPVWDLSQTVGSAFPDEEWDSVGGLVLGLAGRVPVVGESFSVAGTDLTVSKVKGRRVAEVLVTRGVVSTQGAPEERA